MSAKAIVACGFLLAVSAAAAHGKAPHSHHGTADHEVWTTYPLIEETSAPMRNRAVFAVRNLLADTAQIYPPTGAGQFPEAFAVRGSDQPYTAPLERRRFVLNPAGRGNYYWVTARAETANEVRVASSVRYFTNPGPAPTAMLARAKSELEIVPAPLPREHWHYREGETWNFLLRFQGRPLAHAPVWLHSEHGSMKLFESDAQGVAEVTFPRDLPQTESGAAGGHHAQQKAGFVLVAEHQGAGTYYLTAFNYSYAPAAMRGKSLMAGLGFMLLGGLLATPLLRRSGDKEKGTHHV